MTDICPCENCLTLSMCRDRVYNGLHKFVASIETFCPTFKEFVTEKYIYQNMILSPERMEDAGRILGFKVSGDNLSVRRTKRDDNPS